MAALIRGLIRVSELLSAFLLSASATASEAASDGAAIASAAEQLAFALDTHLALTRESAPDHIRTGLQPILKRLSTAAVSAAALSPIVQRLARHASGEAGVVSTVATSGAAPPTVHAAAGSDAAVPALALALRSELLRIWFPLLSSPNEQKSATATAVPIRLRVIAVCGIQFLFRSVWVRSAVRSSSVTGGDSKSPHPLSFEESEIRYQSQWMNALTELISTANSTPIGDSVRVLAGRCLYAFCTAIAGLIVAHSDSVSPAASVTPAATPTANSLTQLIAAYRTYLNRALPALLVVWSDSTRGSETRTETVRWIRALYPSLFDRDTIATATADSSEIKSIVAHGIDQLMLSLLAFVAPNSAAATASTVPLATAWRSAIAWFECADESSLVLSVLSSTAVLSRVVHVTALLLSESRQPAIASCHASILTTLQRVFARVLPPECVIRLLPELCSVRSEIEVEVARVQRDANEKRSRSDAAATRAPLMCAALRVVKEICIGFANQTTAGVDAKAEVDPTPRAAGDADPSDDPIITGLLQFVPPPPASASATASAVAATGSAPPPPAVRAPNPISDAAVQSLLRYALAELTLPSFFGEYIEQHIYSPGSVALLLPHIRMYTFGVAESILAIVCCVVHRVMHAHVTVAARRSSTGTAKFAAVVESELTVPAALRKPLQPTASAAIATPSSGLIELILTCARYECTFDSFIRDLLRSKLDSDRAAAAVDDPTVASAADPKSKAAVEPPHTPWVTPSTRLFAAAILSQLAICCLPPNSHVPPPPLPAPLRIGDRRAEAANGFDAGLLSGTVLVSVLFGRLFRSLRPFLSAGKSSEWKRYLSPRFELFSLFSMFCSLPGLVASSDAATAAATREWPLSVAPELYFEPLPVLLMLTDDYQLHHRVMGVVLLTQLIRSQPAANLRWQRLLLITCLQRVLSAVREPAAFVRLLVPLYVDAVILCWPPPETPVPPPLTAHKPEPLPLAGPNGVSPKRGTSNAAAAAPVTAVASIPVALTDNEVNYRWECDDARHHRAVAFECWLHEIEYCALSPSRQHLQMAEVYLHALPRVILWYRIEIIPYNARFIPVLCSFLRNFLPTQTGGPAPATATPTASTALTDSAARVVRSALLCIAVYLRTCGVVRLADTHGIKLLESLSQLYLQISLAPVIGLNAHVSPADVKTNQPPAATAAASTPALSELLRLTTQTGVLLAQCTSTIRPAVMELSSIRELKPFATELLSHLPLDSAALPDAVPPAPLFSTAAASTAPASTAPAALAVAANTIATPSIDSDTKASDDFIDSLLADLQ